VARARAGVASRLRQRATDTMQRTAWHRTACKPTRADASALYTMKKPSIPHVADQEFAASLPRGSHSTSTLSACPMGDDTLRMPMRALTHAHVWPMERASA
jgi:hypothetical protein